MLELALTLALWAAPSLDPHYVPVPRACEVTTSNCTQCINCALDNYAECLDGGYHKLECLEVYFLQRDACRERFWLC